MQEQNQKMEGEDSRDHGELTTEDTTMEEDIEKSNTLIAKLENPSDSFFESQKSINTEKSLLNAGDFTPSKLNSHSSNAMHNMNETEYVLSVVPTDENVFGDESSVFKITENNCQTDFLDNVKSEALHFEESENAIDELAEIGLSEENLQEFAQSDTQEVTVAINNPSEETNVSHTNTNIPVHPVSLKKSRPVSKETTSVKKNVPGGKVTTLLDLSSIGELKRIWAKADKPVKKSRLNTSTILAHVKPVAGEKPEKIGIDAKIKKRNVANKIHLERNAESQFDTAALQLKDCEVNLVRVENLHSLASTNLKIDLTVPKIVSDQKGYVERKTVKKRIKSSTLGLIAAKAKTLKKTQAQITKKKNIEGISKIQGKNKDQAEHLEEDMLQIGAESLNGEIDEGYQALNDDSLDENDDIDDDYMPSDDENDDDYKPRLKKMKKSKYVKTKPYNRIFVKSEHSNAVAEGMEKCKSGKMMIKGPRIGRPPVLGHFECKICGFTANEKNLVDKHHYTEHRSVLNCEFCKQKFRTMNGLLVHKAYKHDGGKPFKCHHEGCDYTSKNPVDLERHQAKHETELKHVCPICGWRTKWRRNMKHHFILKHSDERKFKCHICEFAAKRSSDLKEHLYRHTDEKPIECSVCGFRVKTNFELKSHKLVHSNEKPFKCTFPGCTSATKTKSDLAKHQRVHQTERPYPCKICGKTYKCQMSLNKHLTYIHVDTRKFKCDICGKDFKNRFSLKKHMALHAGYKPFECSVCQWKFSNKNNMEKHMVTHDTTNRPYPCPLCPHTAKKQDHLLAHIGSVHGNEYAYFCELCRKPFKKYMQLKLHHERMHTKKEIESLKKAVPIDLALMKMEMKLELEEETERRRKRTSRSKSQTSTDVEIKEEPIDEEYGDVVNDKCDEISDVRLNENTGEIEIVKRKAKVGRRRVTKVKTQPVVGAIIPDNDGSLQETSQSRGELEANLDERSHVEETVLESRGKAVDESDVSSLKQNIDINEEIANDSNQTINEDCDQDVIAVKGDSQAHVDDNSQDEEGLGENDKKTNVVMINDDTESENTNDTDGAEIVDDEQKINDKVLITKNDVVTVGIYDEFRLPLATRGFQFNYDKNGTKPMKAWFMDVSLMDPETAEKHKKHRRRLGLLPPIPRGHPQKGYKRLKNFVNKRKKTLADNIKKAKFIKDLGLVSKRNKSRCNRFKGTYAEFETVQGEHLTFTEVQQRLPRVAYPKTEIKEEKLHKKKVTAKAKPVKANHSKVKSLNALSSTILKRNSKGNEQVSKKSALKFKSARNKGKNSTKPKGAKLLLSSEKKHKKKEAGTKVEIRKPTFIQAVAENPHEKTESERDSFVALQSIMKEFEHQDGIQEQGLEDANNTQSANNLKKTKTDTKPKATKAEKPKTKKPKTEKRKQKDQGKPKFNRKYIPVKQNKKRKLEFTQDSLSRKKQKLMKLTSTAEKTTLSALKEKLKASAEKKAILDTKEKLKASAKKTATSDSYTQTAVPEKKKKIKSDIKDKLKVNIASKPKKYIHDIVPLKQYKKQETKQLLMAVPEKIIKIKSDIKDKLKVNIASKPKKYIHDILPLKRYKKQETKQLKPKSAAEKSTISALKEKLKASEVNIVPTITHPADVPAKRYEKQKTKQLKLTSALENPTSALENTISELKEKLKASKANVLPRTFLLAGVYSKGCHLPVPNSQIVMVYPATSSPVDPVVTETNEFENMVVTVNEDFSREDGSDTTVDELKLNGKTVDELLEESVNEEENAEVNNSDSSDKVVMLRGYEEAVVVKEESQADLMFYSSLAHQTAAD